MKKKFIRSNISFWNVFVFFVKKKNDIWKMCIDYKTLNAVILKNEYSLLKIQNCLNMIETAKSFNKIDLINDYWQINVIEKNRHKIAFNTKRKKYEFCVMSFELINASAIFQIIMNDFLRFFFDRFVIVCKNCHQELSFTMRSRQFVK